MVFASLARGILRNTVPDLATALAGQFSDPNTRVDQTTTPSSCPKQVIQRAATLAAPPG